MCLARFRPFARQSGRNFWRAPAGRAVLAVALTAIGTATVFYRFVEDLRWIDSLYFSVITVSTVGASA